MTYDRKYVLWALGYAVAGMGLGIFMAASHQHVQHVTHAHILLVGFVLSLIYGVIHKLWLPGRPSRLADAQFILHQAGVAAMVTGLFLLYGNLVPPAQLEPVLAASSIAILVGTLLMIAMLLRSHAIGTSRVQ